MSPGRRPRPPACAPKPKPRRRRPSAGATSSSPVKLCCDPARPDLARGPAGLRTRAQLEGDHFVDNGQKVWTSDAQVAEFILAFVRTDSDVPTRTRPHELSIP